MNRPTPDTRSPQRRIMDEQIASEPMLAPPELSPDAAPAPVEAFLARRRKPMAVAGVVENGLIRLLDPDVRLPEHTRVIVVATEG